MNIVNSPLDQPDRESKISQLPVQVPLRLVETAFFASTSALVWFINFYFPLGPVLRVLFSIPIALVYLRWGNRASWMTAITSGLLLSVLTGPVRSLLFIMPFAFLGVLLGASWHRRVPWVVSISLGTILCTLGVFFRLWLLSILSGEDLWIYLTNQVTEIIKWLFLNLHILTTPSPLVVKLAALLLIMINNLIYMSTVHLAAWLLLERLGNSIPNPPHWIQVLMNYED
ncbi:DUF2232 domain-containing protein [Cylindrospermopsis raciborskii]|uniref:DUF2232 domain-containing protein n=1 Tax=Cylindrospermopsis raciborskii CENA302 TaxID=1170768 RepID=A0A9Q5W7L1_9CYAN|nr:DUF2232 domain-containing protein [Cylindrospermopsis raciborskii]NLQ06104.1 DUF2232 domain-containing protein [Cylindrospermopsis raciborskii MVCC19]OHY32413.1 hypothetical protein BCV64_13160 [Cylindrospermopsis raciborskii MVCC14]OPH08669.1 hypothetical protein CENA302_14175 [Cylindrospermopsis raciborskii CENA302]